MSRLEKVEHFVIGSSHCSPMEIMREFDVQYITVMKYIKVMIDRGVISKVDSLGRYNILEQVEGDER